MERGGATRPHGTETGRTMAPPATPQKPRSTDNTTEPPQQTPRHASHHPRGHCEGRPPAQPVRTNHVSRKYYPDRPPLTQHDHHAVPETEPTQPHPTHKRHTSQTTQLKSRPPTGQPQNQRKAPNRTWAAPPYSNLSVPNHQLTTPPTPRGTS